MEILNWTLGQEIGKIICHRFVAGILIAHQYITLQRCYFLKAYTAAFKYDFICLSETYLDSSMPSVQVSLDLEGYKLVCADHPNNVKRGGVCIYYNESLPVRAINLSYLQETLLLGLNDQNKNIMASSICRSPSQKKEEFESFNKFWTSPISY